MSEKNKSRDVLKRKLLVAMSKFVADMGVDAVNAPHDEGIPWVNFATITPDDMCEFGADSGKAKSNKPDTAVAELVPVVIN